MLYGSTARGDAYPESDIDVLQLVPSTPGTETHGKISIVSYVPAQLEAMSLGRSLFAWHLRIEGRTIHDPNGDLRRILESHPGPDGAATLDRLRSLSAVLDVEVREFELHEEGLRRVGRFLLRTAVYAKAIDAGAGTFATVQAATVADPSGRTEDVLERLRTPSPDSWTHFVTCRALLAELIGDLTKNDFDSLEALVVRSETSDAGLSSLALHVISNATGELDYSQVEMPIL